MPLLIPGILILYIIVLVVLSEAVLIGSIFPESSGGTVRAVMAILGIVGVFVLPYILGRTILKDSYSGVSKVMGSTSKGVKGFFGKGEEVM